MQEVDDCSYRNRLAYYIAMLQLPPRPVAPRLTSKAPMYARSFRAAIVAALQLAMVVARPAAGQSTLSGDDSESTTTPFRTSKM